MKYLSTLTLLIAGLVACKNHEKATAHNTQSELPVKADTLVYMERTACFGDCPIYSVLVLSDGKTTYHGKRFVEKTGTYTLQLTSDDRQQIIRTADEIHIFNLNNKYDKPITDLPSTLLIYKHNNKRKQIIDRIDAPDSLKRFEKLIDKLIESKEWTAVE